MHNRRARPTLRLLREDLRDGWQSADPRRLLEANELAGLHPLSELSHPIIAKALDSFGDDPSEDNYVGPIAASSRWRLLEIRCSQWRGGVWEDAETGVRWLVVAGLAKGGHKDRGDFYQLIGREDAADTTDRWLPTDEDRRLLKQETAARLRTEWELSIQRDALGALGAISKGGSARFEIMHPVPGQGVLARVDLRIAPVREDRYEADEVAVEFAPEPKFAGLELMWQARLRVLISVEPPEQNWDRLGDTYTNIGDVGAWSQRVTDLSALVEAGDLAVSVPGSTSHYAHREHLAGSTIEGTAVRALCGVHFVPTQDHKSLPPCPSCQEALASLPS